jgi:hypothetical protein
LRTKKYTKKNTNKQSHLSFQKGDGMKKIGKTKKFNPESLKKLEFKDTAPND